MRDGCPKLCISAEWFAFCAPENDAFLQNGSRFAFPTMMHFCSMVRVLRSPKLCISAEWFTFCVPQGSAFLLNG